MTSRPLAVGADDSLTVPLPGSQAPPATAWLPADAGTYWDWSTLPKSLLVCVGIFVAALICLWVIKMGYKLWEKRAPDESTLDTAVGVALVVGRPAVIVVAIIVMAITAIGGAHQEEPPRMVNASRLGPVTQASAPVYRTQGEALSTAEAANCWWFFVNRCARTPTAIQYAWGGDPRRVQAPAPG